MAISETDLGCRPSGNLAAGDGRACQRLRRNQLLAEALALRRGVGAHLRQQQCQGLRFGFDGRIALRQGCLHGSVVVLREVVELQQIVGSRHGQGTRSQQHRHQP